MTQHVCSIGTHAGGMLLCGWYLTCSKEAGEVLGVLWVSDFWTCHCYVAWPSWELEMVFNSFL